MKLRAILLNFVIIMGGLPAAQAAHTGLLNDTGQTACYDDSNNVADCATVAADGGTRPRQDGRYGRDPAFAAGQLAKTGGGAAGFDFTALDGSGNAVAPGAHECVKDNRTQLIWSSATISGVTWAGAAAATGIFRCNLGTGWRVPTTQELLSIAHSGASGPAIDATYFPGTSSAYYWSADTYAPDAASAWAVHFANGAAAAAAKADGNAVRLVCDDTCTSDPPI